MTTFLARTCWVCVFVLAGQGAHAACSVTDTQLRGDWGQARFSVELADDPAERSRGLMNRESLSASAGMLFVYPEPQHARFWMKNTLIPLDMIFIDATGVVTSIHENAIPHDLTAIDGGSGVTAVLEINGGMARKLGISVGSQVQHPSFLQENAIWPCEER
ncbi:MAG: DUF192 domain-containing protein [Marinosulfonomonas sp.]